MLFVLSKLLWGFAAPGSLMALTLALGLVAASCGRGAWALAGRRAVGAAAVFFLALTVLPLGEWALTPLENATRFVPPEQVDGLIVIGGDEKTDISQARGMPVALDSMRRHLTFTELARRYPDAKLVFSGGSGLLSPQARMLDAEVARQILAEMGLPVGRLILEKTSRNTYENAVFSADIVRPGPQEKWILVTSAWHMPRALACFRKAGWSVTPAPTGYFTDGTYHAHGLFRFDEQVHMLTLAAHEYVGLLAYRLLGRIDTLWPPQNI